MMRVETTRWVSGRGPRWCYVVRDDEGVFEHSGYRYKTEDAARRAGERAIKRAETG